MDEVDTTNGRLARVIADVEQLIEWAKADTEASYEAGAVEQAEADLHRAGVLTDIHLTLLKIKR